MHPVCCNLLLLTHDLAVSNALFYGAKLGVWQVGGFLSNRNINVRRKALVDLLNN